MSNLIELSKAHRLRALNKSELAQFFDVSLPTVEAWIRRGCPVVEKGGRGKPWVLDALDVAKWKFTGGEGGEPQVDPDSMIPTDRKAWYESETKRRALQVADRELIPASEVAEVIQRAMATLGQGLRSLPDILERRYGFPPELIQAFEDAQLSEVEMLSERLSVLGPVEQGDE